MNISVNQVHNVLRTYRRLVRQESDQTERHKGKESLQEQVSSPLQDTVSLSAEAIKRLKEAGKQHQ